jgi:hypothetical protein
MKVVSLSVLCTGRFYPPGIIPGTHFCYGLSQPQGHSAAGRIMSMKNSSDTIGNRTRDLPACSTVPQPNAPPRNPNRKEYKEYFLRGEGGKDGESVALTTLPTSCADCLETWEPQPPGTLRACQGL